MMNDDEWRKFLAELFTAFPGMKDYIESRSDNPKGTTNTWRTTLDGISYDEAKQVLNDWLMGRREAPKAYERDYIAITIRSIVVRTRQDQWHAQNLQRKAEEKRLADETRHALVGLGVYPAFMACLTVNERLASKEISEHEHYLEIQKILRVVA